MILTHLNGDFFNYKYIFKYKSLPYFSKKQQVMSIANSTGNKKTLKIPKEMPSNIVSVRKLIRGVERVNGSGGLFKWKLRVESLLNARFDVNSS